ncbi:MAG: EpsG family protein [Oscillospiraceae bacterium]|nr:EpsG family protein [Oscillospiraceae bacterium]
MSELLPITITSIILAWLSQHVNTRKLTEDGQYKKDWIIYAVMAVCMILFAGLRTGFNDTETYLNTYQTTSYDSSISWKLGNNPGYSIVIKLLKLANFSGQSYLMFYALFIIGIYLWFIRKYSTNLWLSIFLLFTAGCYVFSLAAIKQCAAIAFGLLATDRYIRKRYIPFAVYLLIGMLFHPYVLMFFLIPILDFHPWTVKTWIILGAFFIAGILLQPLLGTVINITAMLGESFNIEEFSGEGVNPFRLAVVSVPVVISFFTRRIIRDENNRIQNLILNLTMMNATIMFVGLFGTANYFARLANYFLIFQCLSLPWLLNQFEHRTKRILTCLAIVCFIVFFVYENSLHGSFNNNYSAISLIDYIKSLL